MIPPFAKTGWITWNATCVETPLRRAIYALWMDLISRDPNEIVRELLADTGHGALLRETRPVFYVLAGAEREQALARAREER
jgi:hypothetical protein